MIIASQSTIWCGIILAVTLSYHCCSANGGQERKVSAAEEVNGKKAGHVPKIFDYESYVDKYRKKYKPIETLNKARLFFGRTLQIFKHNVLYKKGQCDYYLAQNEFTDLTPDELHDQFSKKNFQDMQPVVEALANPDAPADSFLDADSGAEDVELSSTNIEHSTPTPIGSVQQQVDGSSILNFLGDQSVEDPRKILEEIKTDPKMANKIAIVADLKEKEVVNSEKTSEEARIKNNILYRPMVKSNNDKYDLEMITSYGLFSDWKNRNKPENYAKFVLEGDFDFNLEPYPISKPPDRPVLSNDKPALKGFIDSVKDVYSFFTFDDSLVDYYDEDEEEEEGKEEEFHDAKDTFTSSEDQQKKKKIEEEQEKKKAIEYDVDWRDTGCISKAKAQESCNCCYAFAALSLMEYFYCTQKKKLTEFSAQYVVDCGTRANLNGCRGGKISGVGSFITKYGVELNTLYPYVGIENQCPYNDHEELASKGGYLKPEIKAWQNFATISAWSKWLKKSPIIVGINMPVDFLAYEGGIHNGLNCDEKMVHALLLVGSGVQDGKKFWLLKNSYSSEWGESGYIRLSKAAPIRCFNMATVVRAHFNGD